jgi:putative transcriptional regulator
MKNRIRVLRAETKLTQEELAKRVGVSRQAIIAIEAEKFDPSLPLAFRIATVFSARIDEVFLPAFDDPEVDRM